MSIPTIKDIAESAGVSIATVSHVINKTRFVSEKVRERVQKAIEKLNYIPSSTAKNLASQKTKTIGIVVPQIINPFFNSIIQGISKELSRSYYEIVLAETYEKEYLQEKEIKNLIKKRVDGIIIAPTSGNSKNFKYLLEISFPLVLIDRYIEGKEFELPLVAANSEKGAFDLTNHLIKDGHSVIGYIKGEEKISNTHERLRGFKRALEVNGISFHEELVVKGESTVEGGLYGAIELVKNYPKLTAIFSSNNFITLGVLKAFQMSDIECPSKIALASFDDHDWAYVSNPPLTVYKQPTYEIGKKAGELILKWIKNGRGSVSHEKIFMDGELIIRGSCSVSCFKKYIENNKFKESKE